ncbi:hypothetical protein MSAN_01579900 [Mycena sanguinolenta]|uniref:Uncharacterized protein n=1 Tax=Mycena sanguinolenta TaxID=230812 RepID=A0A8H7CX73_9AGAR|nr:hypothetical protein MSAN_01579900 [Mycena sanguinolenta]
MALATCVPTTATFRLHNFQGHTLNLAGGVNPVVSFTAHTPPGPNEKWSFTSDMELKGSSGEVVSSAMGSPSFGPGLAQAVTTSGTGLSLTVTCINATSAYITEPALNALTAWAARHNELQSPVTFEIITLGSEQAWTFEGLD